MTNAAGSHLYNSHSDWDSGGDGEGSNSYERVRSDTPSILFKTMIDEALR